MYIAVHTAYKAGSIQPRRRLCKVHGNGIIYADDQSKEYSEVGQRSVKQLTQRCVRGQKWRFTCWNWRTLPGSRMVRHIIDSCITVVPLFSPLVRWAPMSLRNVTDKFVLNFLENLFKISRQNIVKDWGQEIINIAILCFLSNLGHHVVVQICSIAIVDQSTTVRVKNILANHFDLKDFKNCWNCTLKH